jgi:hypothetical protein
MTGLIFLTLKSLEVSSQNTASIAPQCPQGARFFLAFYSSMLHMLHSSL